MVVVMLVFHASDEPPFVVVSEAWRRILRDYSERRDQFCWKIVFSPRHEIYVTTQDTYHSHTAAAAFAFAFLLSTCNTCRLKWLNFECGGFTIGR